MQGNGTLKELLAATRAYAQPTWKQGLAEALITALLLGTSLLTGWWLCSQWAPLGLVVVPAAALMVVRMFILQHDCGHGSLLPSRQAGDALGWMLSWVTLAPYAYWRRTHALHHARWNDLEDPDPLGYLWVMSGEDYRQASPKIQRSYRLYRNPWLLLLLGVPFQFFVKHRFPWDMPRGWHREWAGVAWCNAGFVTLLLGSWFGAGSGFTLWVVLPSLFSATVMGGALFLLQHTFPAAYHGRGDDWSFLRAALEGSSHLALPPWLHWCTGHIGLHHLHHLNPRIPSYRLVEATVIVDVPGLSRRDLWGAFWCALITDDGMAPICGKMDP